MVWSISYFHFSYFQTYTFDIWYWSLVCHFIKAILFQIWTTLLVQKILMTNLKTYQNHISLTHNKQLKTTHNHRLVRAPHQALFRFILLWKNTGIAKENCTFIIRRELYRNKCHDMDIQRLSHGFMKRIVLVILISNCKYIS